MAIQVRAFVFRAIRCVLCRDPAADEKAVAVRCTECDGYLCARCRFLRGGEHDCEGEKRRERQSRREFRGAD